MIVKIGAVVSYSPVFLPPALVVVSIGIWLGKVYIKAQLSVKREMSNCKAPVLSMIGGAIQGLGKLLAGGLIIRMICSCSDSLYQGVFCAEHIQGRVAAEGKQLHPRG